MTPFRKAIEAADCTDPPVALEHSFAKVSGIAAQFPLLNAPIGAEGQASGRNFQVAPATKAPSIRTPGQTGAFRAATGHRTLHGHVNRI